jgi:hypothetical protein
MAPGPTNEENAGKWMREDRQCWLLYFSRAREMAGILSKVFNTQLRLESEEQENIGVNLNVTVTVFCNLHASEYRTTPSIE